MSDPAYLHTVTLDELMDNVFEGKSAVIENLLYTGAYILAGAPKIGKSFLVAQIAHHVSTGQDLWGYKTHQGTVLYLALEDDESRLQRRMFRMFGVEGTSSLHFATNAKMIGSGLDEQLEKFVREHSDTKLIIVDTLQKVREAVSDSYSYSSDYEVIGKLKQFADRYGVCVLIVHHTRKQPAGDSFEMISGTTGLLGCADGALLMQKEKRTDSKATLEVVGRDQPDQRLYLSKDQENLIWSLDHAENELWKQPHGPGTGSRGKDRILREPRMGRQSHRTGPGDSNGYGGKPAHQASECECQPSVGRTSGKVREQNQTRRTAYPADLHGGGSTRV